MASAGGHAHRTGSALALAAMLILSGCTRDDAAERAARSLPSPNVLGETGLSPGQFAYPRCIDADGGGLWVIDKSARLQRIDPATGRATVVYTMPDWQNGKPCGVTVGPAPASPAPGSPWAPGASDRKLVYIADTHEHRVLIVEAVESGEPRILAKFGAFGRGPGEFIYPTDVAVLTDDTGHAARLYVSEYGDNDRVSVFDAASLTFLFSFGSLGDAIEPAQIEFQRPQSLLIDRSRDRLIVTDACNHRLGVFTLSGTLVRWIGSPAGAGHDREGFAYPYGLAGLADGTVLVSELGNHRVKRVDVTTGATLDVFGVQGRAPGELVSPWGVCVMDERIFVLDSGNDRIQSFRPRSFRASPLALAPSAKASAGGPP